MYLKLLYASALLFSYSGLSWGPPGIPEIDGGLSIQALALVAGVVFLMKRKK